MTLSRRGVEREMGPPIFFKPPPHNLRDFDLRSTSPSNKNKNNFQGTFPGFLDLASHVFPQDFQLLADIPYREIFLKSEEGTNVFQHLEDGMILMSTKI